MEVIWILIRPHPLTNLEIQKCYQNEPRFNEFYSTDNLPNEINESADVGTHWIPLYCKSIEIICFDSCGVELENFIGHKKIKTNIFRIQSTNSIMCGYFCIGFIDVSLQAKL